MMDEADAIIANLTPFRGPGADAVYELGYMAARGKFCLGYSNDPAIYADRVRRSVYSGIGIASVMMLILALIVWLAPAAMIRLFSAMIVVKWRRPLSCSPAPPPA